MQFVIKPEFSNAKACLLNVKQTNKTKNQPHHTHTKKPHHLNKSQNHLTRTVLYQEEKMRQTSPTESARKHFPSGFDQHKLH